MVMVKICRKCNKYIITNNDKSKKSLEQKQTIEKNDLICKCEVVKIINIKEAFKKIKNKKLYGIKTI